MSISALHENIDGFYKKIAEEHQEDMACKKGCDKCCYVALSIFPIEADYITDCFEALNQQNRDKLVTLWNSPVSEGEDLFGKQIRACAFLYEGACSIYEARPGICRTQGAPMIRKEVNQMELDVCSLNFKTTEPTIEMSYDLNRLNMLLSLAQNSKPSKRFTKERVTLNQLKKFLSNL